MRALAIALAFMLPATAVAQEEQAPIVQDEIVQEEIAPPPEESEAEREARLRDQAGEIAFHHGVFETALEDFTRALELAPSPDRMLSRARALDALRRETEVLELYRAFLATAPNDPRAGEVRARIAVLEAREAAPASERAPAPEAPPIQADTEQREFYDEPWFWVGAGIIVVSVIVAVILGAVTETPEEPIPGDDGVVVRTLVERM